MKNLILFSFCVLGLNFCPLKGATNESSPTSKPSMSVSTDPKLNSEPYFAGEKRKTSSTDHLNNKAPEGFVYDERDRLIPLDQFENEDDRKMILQIRKAVEELDTFKDRNVFSISLKVARGQIHVLGWLPGGKFQESIQNRIQETAKGYTITFELAS